MRESTEEERGCKDDRDIRVQYSKQTSLSVCSRLRKTSRCSGGAEDRGTEWALRVGSFLLLSLSLPLFLSLSFSLSFSLFLSLSLSFLSHSLSPSLSLSISQSFNLSLTLSLFLLLFLSLSLSISLLSLALSYLVLKSVQNVFDCAPSSLLCVLL